MASVNLTSSYLHRANDIDDYVSFPEAASNRSLSTRTGVRSYSDGKRRVVASPDRDRLLRLQLPVVPRSTANALREYLSEVVLFRSPTGEYVYAQLIEVSDSYSTQVSDSDVGSVSLVLDPVDPGGI